MDCIVWNRGVLYMDSILCGRRVVWNRRVSWGPLCGLYIVE